jgi:hypothetical protein
MVNSATASIANLSTRMIGQRGVKSQVKHSRSRLRYILGYLDMLDCARFSITSSRRRMRRRPRRAKISLCRHALQPVNCFQPIITWQTTVTAIDVVPV